MGTCMAKLEALEQEERKKMEQENKNKQQSEKKYGPSCKSSDQGIVSEVHRAHQNQIVFSNKEINFRNATEDQFTNQFSQHGPIFGFVYLSQSLKNHTYEADVEKDLDYGDLVGFRVTIDGQLLPEQKRPRPADADEKAMCDQRSLKDAYVSFWLERYGEDAAKEWTGYPIAIAPSHDWEYGKKLSIMGGMAKRMCEAFANLSPGNHTVQIDMVVQWQTDPSGVSLYNETRTVVSSRPIATGTFQLMIDEKDKQKYIDDAEFWGDVGGQAAKDRAAREQAMINDIAKRQAQDCQRCNKGLMFVCKSCSHQFCSSCLGLENAHSPNCPQCQWPHCEKIS